MDNDQATDNFDLFHESAALLACSRDLASTLQAITEKIHNYCKPESTCLLLLDENTGDLRCETVIGSGAEEMKGARMKLEDAAEGWSAQTPEPLVGPAPKRANPVAQFAPEPRGQPDAVLYLPIRGSEKILGTFKLVKGAARGAFGRDEISALRVLAGYAAIALENERHVQRIHALTITDDCTGLYNARHLKVMLEAEVYRSARFGHEFSLIFMDLDYFKDINDRHGHLMGSRLLGSIGELIKSHLRLIDSAFRYGGDEFILLLPQTSRRNALVVVRRLKETLDSQVFFAGEGSNIRITASYGVASFPADGSDAQEVLLKADRAMYQVKTSGGNDIGLAGQAESAD